jgi:hypothetical protein
MFRAEGSWKARRGSLLRSLVFCTIRVQKTLIARYISRLVTVNRLISRGILSGKTKKYKGRNLIVFVVEE